MLSIEFHFHVCLTNVSDSLETARKGVSDGVHLSAMKCFNFLLLLATMVLFSEVQFQETKGSSAEVSQICMVLGWWMGQMPHLVNNPWGSKQTLNYSSKVFSMWVSLGLGLP